MQRHKLGLLDGKWGVWLKPTKAAVACHANTLASIDRSLPHENVSTIKLTESIYASAVRHWRVSFCGWENGGLWFVGKFGGVVEEGQLHAKCCAAGKPLRPVN